MKWAPRNFPHISIAVSDIFNDRNVSFLVDLCRMTAAKPPGAKSQKDGLGAFSFGAAKCSPWALGRICNADHCEAAPLRSRTAPLSGNRISPWNGAPQDLSPSPSLSESPSSVGPVSPPKPQKDRGKRRRCRAIRAGNRPVAESARPKGQKPSPTGG